MSKALNILAIGRSPQYSPNAVDRDRAILERVMSLLRQRGHQVTGISEDELSEVPQHADVILSMGRQPLTLNLLSQSGGIVINAPDAVARCSRWDVNETMRRLQLPTPPEHSTNGYWLKRGDAAAQRADDVVFTADRTSLERAIGVMLQRGIRQYVVSAHIVGDLVKCYGVRGTQFFHYCYPTEDGESKFGDEKRNGPPHHYPFRTDRLQAAMERLADDIGMEIYGGDAIVRSDGSFFLIDFNDWPSFSRCREEAAAAIVRLVTIKTENETQKT